MTIRNISATAAALALLTASASAQQAQTDQDETTQERAEEAQTQAPQTQGEGPLVATVGEAEITGADVARVIDTLPPQLRQQPPQLLVPMAVDSLVLRELVLGEARAQNLGDDPEVQALVDASAQTAEEDAMVQVYLQREIDTRITDEAVQQTYDTLTQDAQGDAPPLEQVRPQIEQRLGQQALQELRSELEGDVEVVFYGPDGQPMEAAGAQATGDQAGTGEGAQAAGTGQGDDGAGSDRTGEDAEAEADAD